MLDFAITCNGGGTLSDVRVSTTSVALSGSVSPTTQNITITGFGTPKAAIFWLSANTALDTKNSTLADFSYGIFDGTNSYCAINKTIGGITGTTNRYARTSNTTNVAGVFTPTTSGNAVYLSIVANSFITDGVEIEVTGGTDAYLLTVMLIGGADVSAVVGTKVLSGAGTAQTVTPGIRPDVIFSAMGTTTIGATNTASMLLNMGAAVWNGSAYDQGAQYCESNGSTSATTGMATSTGILCDSANSTGLAVSNQTSTTFDITDSSASLTWGFGYLALQLAAGGAVLNARQTPASTGAATFNHGITGGVFEGAVMLKGRHSALNTPNTAGLSTGFGIGFLDADGNEYTCIHTEQDNRVTGVVKSEVSTTLGELRTHDDLAAFEGAAQNIDNDGYEINFTAIGGSQVYWHEVQFYNA